MPVLAFFTILWYINKDTIVPMIKDDTAINMTNPMLSLATDVDVFFDFGAGLFVLIASFSVGRVAPLTSFSQKLPSNPSLQIHRYVLCVISIQSASF